jgi:uncharacterized membrane protein YjjB (DUF3815 family)
VTDALTSLLAPLWAGVATGGFAVLFNLRGKDLPLAAAGGALGWAVAAPMQAAGLSQATAYLLASTAIGIWSEVVAALRRRPASVYIACGIIPLVPGGGMYYTMLEYVRGNNWNGLSTGLATLLAAGAIAVGLAISSAVSRLISLRSIARRLTSPGRSPRKRPPARG